MEKRRFYELLAKNPYGVMKTLISRGRRNDLLGWIRKMAMEYKVTLMLLPNSEREIVKWRVIARVYLNEYIHNEPEYEDIIERLKKLQSKPGLWEVVTHFRRAHIMHRGGKEIMREGTIVRDDKLDETTLKDMTYVKYKYNIEMRKQAKAGNYRFMSMAEYMKGA